ncbi:MAG: glycosyltransferase family 4 protein, partial [Anaerolineae bacterium]|nr:glycosyltransferase family 4 protein [Anaerolineae bacterium]
MAIRLVLFFTRGVSLREWAQNGMLDRETALYHALQQKNVQTSFITHGLAADLQYTERLQGIRVYCNRKGRSPQRYESWLPFLHLRPLLTCDVIKTNQMNGAELALRAARLYHKPLIARCGYLWSEFAEIEHGVESPLTQKAYAIEEKVFCAATQIIVTTPMMRDSILKRLPEVVSKINVIPNFVDTNHFTPMPAPAEVDLLFIGRLHPQKNLENLLTAIQPLEITLRIIGTGPLAQDLKAKFGDNHIEWIGNLPNSDLPHYINRARLFILPSLYEGHPKTLIEAMACGKAVIGGNSPGIREIIQHGKTGWLSDTDPESIRAAIQALLQNPDLCAELGQNARQYALKNYALPSIADKEYTILQQ